MIEFRREQWLDMESCWISLIPQRDKDGLWELLHIGRITGHIAAAVSGGIRYTDDDLPENLTLQIIGKRRRIFNDKARRRMDLGCQAEPILKNWYTKEYNKEVKEVGIAIWKKDPFLGASPDGLLNDGGIVEFKYKEEMPSGLQFQAKMSGGIQGKVFAHIPRRDFDQIQHTMGVLQSPYCDYVVLSPKVGIYTERIPFMPKYFSGLLEKYNIFKERYLLPCIEKYKVEIIPPYIDYTFQRKPTGESEVKD